MRLLTIIEEEEIKLRLYKEFFDSHKKLYDNNRQLFFREQTMYIEEELLKIKTEKNFYDRT